MNVKIELNQIFTKERLIQELKNIVENIERFDRFDPIRTVPHHGTVTVTKEGEFAKYALLDRRNDRVIRYYFDEDYKNGSIEQYDHVTQCLIEIKTNMIV